MKTKALCSLYALLLVIVVAPCHGRPQLLVRRQLTDAVKRGAICSDHSPAIYYTSLRPGQSRWVIFFESGGVCNSEANCQRRLAEEPHLMSSRGYPSAIVGHDLLSDMTGENPFAGFNRVLVPYCSSDLFLGDFVPERIFPDRWNGSYKGEEFAFAGRRIARAVLADLSDPGRKSGEPSLQSASKILLAGSSAGGLAAINHVRWMMHHLLRNDTSVSLLLDSSVFVDFYSQAAQLMPQVIHERAKLSTLRMCAKRDGPVPCCVSVACMLQRNHVPRHVRVLLLASRHDVFILGRALNAMDDDGMLDSDADSLRVRTTVSEYGGVVNATLSRALHAHAAVSVVQVGCAQHVFFAASSLWTDDGVLAGGAVRQYDMKKLQFWTTIAPGMWSRVSVHGRVLRSLVTSWWREKGTIHLFDTCQGLSCNPSCPDRLVVTGTLATTWSGSTRWIAVGLCVLVLISCCLLKLLLWLSARDLHSKMEKFVGELTPIKGCECLPECPAFAGISVACHGLTYAIPVETESVKKMASKASGRDASTTLKAHDEVCFKQRRQSL